MTRKEYRRRYYLPQAKIHKGMTPTCIDCGVAIDSTHKWRCDKHRRQKRNEDYKRYRCFKARQEEKR